MAIDKVIVTNASALIDKYGPAGHSKIKAGLAKLVRADAKRGLSSKVIAIDSAHDMAAYGGASVASHTDARATKQAIDAIYTKTKPDYILILGSGEIVPWVRLNNPVYSPDEDDDKTVPSDLPYACNTAYSTDINRFVGPTRVVGRLPDLVGADTPEYLLKLLAFAADYKTLNAADYQQFFGVSARTWQASTQLSLYNIFGASGGMNIVPTGGPSWSASQLAPRAHFINCHGENHKPRYLGQRGKNYPVAHSADMLPGKIMPGTVLAAECCYGAQLYNPVHSNGQAGIAYTYLGEGAYGVFGSTTIAYGPSSGNGSADLICQYFMLAVMGGASLGRAALEARHQFAGQYSHLSPTDLKTLAQFYLLGDPSIQAAAIEAHALNQSKTFQSAFAKTKDAGVRALRRERLHRAGTSLHKYLPAVRAAKPGQEAQPSREVADILASAARETGLEQHTGLHFHVAPKGRFKSAADSKRTIHLLMSATKIGKQGNDKIKQIVALIATAEDGKLIHLRRLHSR